MNYFKLALVSLFFILPSAFGQDQAPSPNPAAVAATKAETRLATTLPALEQYAIKAQKQWQMPGLAIAVVQGDKMVYAKGFGVRAIDATDPVDTHTIFQIGSISKSFTSALMAQLIDEKKIKWDDRVTDYLPDFQMYDPWVTREFRIEDLFAQWSGLPSHADDMQGVLGLNRDQIIHNLRYIKPITSFRYSYAYQNGLLLVPAKIEEKISGRSWEQLLKERLLDPLGMTATTSTLQGYLAASNRAALHEHQWWNNNKTKKFSDHWSMMDWPYTFSPAGGINSNILDMAQWLGMQMNNGKWNDKQIVSQENMKQLHRPHIYVPIDDPEKPAAFYALSWVSRSYSPYSIIWHDGGTSGANNIIAYIPEKKIGIVILTNATNTFVPYAIAWKFFDLYFNKKNAKDWIQVYTQDEQKMIAEYKEKLPKKPNPAQPSLLLSEYTGTYHSVIYGDATITLKDRQLTLTLGPRPVKLILTPWSGNLFSAKTSEMSSPEPVLVSFRTDETGKPVAFSSELLNEATQDEFVKTEPTKEKP